MKLAWKIIPTFAKAVGRFFGALFRGAPVVVDHDVRTARLLRCRKCPRYYEPAQQCGLCLCDVELKTWVATESCPDARWKQQTRFSRGI